MRTSSGIEIKTVYDTPADPDRIGQPGEYPYTRGPHPTMYRGRPWTMRQYAGFGRAEDTNARFRDLLEAGQTGLSVAFDLPTQMGLDSDDALSAGEVGKVGVAIDTVDDMRRLFADIPLSEVSTSMTINATAAILLLLYQLVAEEQGIPSERIRGTVQNDILKEYAARGTYIYPPHPSMRLVTDLFAYAAAELPAFNTISISGYHIREAGSTAAQEIAFMSRTRSLIRRHNSRPPLPPTCGVITTFGNSHNGLVAATVPGRKRRARAHDPAFGERPRQRRLVHHFAAGDVHEHCRLFHERNLSSFINPWVPGSSGILIMTTSAAGSTSFTFSRGTTWSISGTAGAGAR